MLKFDLKEVIAVIGLSMITLSLLYISIQRRDYGTNNLQIDNLPTITVIPVDQISSISLKKIFQADHNWIATLSADRVRTVIATGDVIPARSVNYQTIRRNDFIWPFTKTAEILRSGDLTVINLESPLIEDCPLTQTGMVFCGDPRQIEGLVYAGVDVAGLGNNHTKNYGREGLFETATLLNSSGILPVGADNQPAFITVKDKIFAFIAFDDLEQNQYSVDPDYEEKIISIISLAKQKAAIVVISFHWGIEYVRYPTERQIQLAHFSIEAGADLVLGNHPHWVQGVEIYKDKFIVYAQGNFVFDQMWSEETKRGVIGKYTFYDDKMIDVEYIPVHIYDYGQPDFAAENEKNRIMASMEEASYVIANIL